MSQVQNETKLRCQLYYIGEFDEDLTPHAGSKVRGSSLQLPVLRFFQGKSIVEVFHTAGSVR